MARPRYTITASDRRWAVAYLERRLREPHYLNHLADAEALRACTSFRTASGKAPRLNAWAELYLDRTRWNHLKDALRQQRRRATAPDRKSVTLTRKAWKYLSDLARHDQVTLSRVVERYLHGPWKNRG